MSVGIADTQHVCVVNYATYVICGTGSYNKSVCISNSYNMGLLQTHTTCMFVLQTHTTGLVVLQSHTMCLHCRVTQCGLFECKHIPHCVTRQCRHTMSAHVSIVLQTHAACLFVVHIPTACVFVFRPIQHVSFISQKHTALYYRQIQNVLFAFQTSTTYVYMEDSEHVYLYCSPHIQHGFRDSYNMLMCVAHIQRSFLCCKIISRIYLYCRLLQHLFIYEII